MKIVKDELAEQQRTELGKAIASAANARWLKDVATADFVTAEAEVQRLLRALGEKRSHNGEHQVTLVEAERVKIDVNKLQDRLGERLWDQVTSSTFDKAKLENAVELGIIPAEIVAECATIEKNKPFVRFSLYEADEDA